MLFDAQTDPNTLNVAQAALLLSYWNPHDCPGQPRMDTVWLCIAIQHSKAVHADRYDCFKDTELIEDVDRTRQNSLKRLWWCCVIRDRTMSLCLRRHTQIDPHDFNPLTRSVLAYSDLSDDIDHSKFYSPTSKRNSVAALELLLTLCKHMTLLLPLIFSSCVISQMKIASPPHDVAIDLENQETLLQDWAEMAVKAEGKFQQNHGKDDDVHRDVISAFFDQTWLYYQ